MTDQLSTTTVTTVNRACFKRMVEGGLAWFERHYQIVNDLNVYPVPDGDTGTNMLLTLREAYRRMNETGGGVRERALALADGAVNGSKGNSGTLLSQMFDGFAKSLTNGEDIDAAGLARGLREAVRSAYKALQNPVEGTILTVAREIAEEVESVAKTTSDLKKILEHIVERGTISVARTPDLLPKLKQAGVVDSGGRGLVYFFEGMLRVARGEALPMTAPSSNGHSAPTAALPASQRAMHDTLKSDDERGYGYDVQYVVRGQNLNVDQIRLDIAAMGDSMVVVGDESRVKVHIHVHDPGVPISYGIKLGVITDVVVENMQEQFEDYVERHAALPPSELEIGADDLAVIAVSPGEGLAHVFKDTGAAVAISGGQSSNPSVADFLAAMDRVPAQKFILLPNNKNVVLTADLAAKQAAKTGKQVTVVPTTSIPQGLAAMYAFSPQGELEQVTAEMIANFPTITTGEITQATRTVQLDGVDVKEGQFIGLVNGKLVISNNELRPLILGLLERMNASSAEIITLYYGEMVTEDEAQELATWLSETISRDGLPEFIIHYGGQPYYEYILSAE
ncbi:MAG: DAK2 domain-containing protein [Anaerolineae bacterium]|nr:DAK2 domain-containing protein [Anaerolineae bacterium]